METPVLPILLGVSFVIVGVLFFFGLWLLICFGMSHSGWKGLADRYPAPEQPNGTHFRPRILMVGIARYKGVVNLYLRDDGFFLSIVSAFRFGHPPLFIPWSAVRETPEDGILYKMVKLEVETAKKSIPVRIPADIPLPAAAKAGQPA